MKLARRIIPFNAHVSAPGHINPEIFMTIYYRALRFFLFFFFCFLPFLLSFTILREFLERDDELACE